MNFPCSSLYLSLSFPRCFSPESFHPFPLPPSLSLPLDSLWCCTQTLLMEIDYRKKTISKSCCTPSLYFPLRSYFSFFASSSLFLIFTILWKTLHKYESLFRQNNFTGNSTLPSILTYDLNRQLLLQDMYFFSRDKQVLFLFFAKMQIENCHYYWKKFLFKYFVMYKSQNIFLKLFSNPWNHLHIFHSNSMIYWQFQ